MTIHALGSSTVGDAPRVAAVIGGDADSCLELAQVAKREGADIIEFRADFCTNVATEPDKVSSLIREVKDVSGLPVLLTIRHFAEGGYFMGSAFFEGSEVERLNTFKHLIPEVDAIDIEIHAEEIRDDVVKFAHAAEKLVVLSYHNFKHTPRLGKLKDLIEDAHHYGADILKIAVMATSEEDVALLSRFTAENNNNILLTTISMGEIGVASRIINPFLGSCLTYGYVGTKPTTPGQLRVSDLRKFIDAFPGQRIATFEEAEKIMHMVLEDAPVFA